MRMSEKDMACISYWRSESERLETHCQREKHHRKSCPLSSLEADVTVIQLKRANLKQANSRPEKLVGAIETSGSQKYRQAKVAKKKPYGDDIEVEVVLLCL